MKNDFKQLPTNIFEPCRVDAEGLDAACAAAEWISPKLTELITKEMGTKQNLTNLSRPGQCRSPDLVPASDAASILIIDIRTPR